MLRAHTSLRHIELNFSSPWQVTVSLLPPLCVEKKETERTQLSEGATLLLTSSFPDSCCQLPERRVSIQRGEGKSPSVIQRPGKKMFSSPITAAVEVEVVVKVVEVVVRFNSLQSAGQCEEESGNRRQTERERGGERERLRERERD